VENSSDPFMTDRIFMQRALCWAERGRGRTSPNPMVGAVVVTRDGVVVGQGAHLAAGTPHAEVHALEEAGARAEGATLYCTLEPCCHVGRTGPCVDRIVAAKISRVVASIEDPNPRVAGKGVAFLRGHGVSVDVGLGGADAARQNESFFTWIRRRRPFVILKAAVSDDGFVGRRDRRERLTGPVADRWFHRQRAEVDAIAVGSGTVLVDDPRLTPREVFRIRPLTRVLFDWRLRIPLSARVFSTLEAGPVIMMVSDDAARERPGAIEAATRRGATVEILAAPDLAGALGRLADRGVLSLLVEGGPSLQSAFAAAGLVDRVQRVATPVTLGGGVAAAPVVQEPPGTLARTLRLGGDTLSEFDVHRTD
jgi:diaminohydroxyphosphoribosylaminopyrimidine deaminase/5-amino-6-(5-phosphoribosylamino)uracil reductase